ncbi:MAG TPA: hypothetical protein DEB39_09380 [Planctomycetaceae bacterium]|nr:hypothetical protein [Planctomycetaceae bacterium]
MAARLTAVLRAAKETGVRPIILLNGHHGGPCPYHHREMHALEDAPKGSIIATIRKTGGCVGCVCQRPNRL